MKPLALFSLLLGLVEMSVGAHAEGGCPPGMIPYSGTNISSCGPIPGYSQQRQATRQPPSPQWEDRWGAIATDEPHGILGSATGMSSRDQAERTALADCRAKGGSPCKLETWYSNGCAVLVVGDKGYNTNSEASLDATIQSGMKTCGADGDTGCRVYYSACSPPVRVR